MHDVSRVPLSPLHQVHIISNATVTSSFSEITSSKEASKHLMENVLLSSVMAYKPLNRRLVTIRQDEDVDFALCNTKYFSIEQETDLVLSHIKRGDSYSVDKMIDRAILFTYLGMRTSVSLTTFLGSIHRAHEGQTEKQDYIKHWFLNEIKKFETRPDYFSVKRQSCLVLMLHSFMENGLVDAVDCSKYFSSHILKTLDLIPSTTWFDRRLERWKATILKAEASPFKSTTQQANKIAHHYILETMYADNTANGYLTLPMDQVLNYRYIFCSYLRQGVPAETIFSVILDLWMDEIEHNNLFWLHLIEQCSGDLAIPASDFVLKVGSAFHQLVIRRYNVNKNADKKRKCEASSESQERFSKVRVIGKMELETRKGQQKVQGEKGKHDGVVDEAPDDKGDDGDDTFGTSTKSTEKCIRKTNKGRRKIDTEALVKSKQVTGRRFLPRRCKSGSSSNPE
ncbi:hypothetical protein [Absidia glauca]|uniref:Uncharacterized protein n=1 Tax=Absidia glauca TaxID=4829 RepID=A0A163LPK3_ABSGL|nr:hypothetical protein [Absidia glauca]